MSGRKIHPAFAIFCGVGVAIMLFALFGSLVAGAKVDDAGEDKGEIQLQLATMLNFIVAGLALILAGVGFQLAAGPKTAAPPAPTPYAQGPQQYQAQPPPAGGQWGQQHPGQH
ncbi:hypothetical protein E1293_29265 [Actinomadura darangshiensis]|uniref:Uncharacterized protein n=1 Tax=Actinomadura darangshiensis TaxID=705336 RepID=A0A4R5ATZ8_9ACTN|nr:hypothetical protein [Actinomadura darangshiensis]TDD74594.1 hypothetical protein E1293_29265 [Actinomadura darangshiensis]